MATKVVADANIWISRIITGDLGDFEMMAYANDIEFVRCKDLTDEIEKVLSRPKFAKYLVYTVGQYIDNIKSSSTFFRIRHEFKGCRDPKDNYLFDLAVQAKAKYIVSGDRDVSETTVGSPIEIVTLAKFKEIMKRGLN